MGLLDFLSRKHASAPAPTGATNSAAAPASELKKELEKLGFDASKVNIVVDGGRVTLTGTTRSTADAEKIAVAIGNTKGVTQVANNLSAEKAEANSVIYTVKDGNSLWKIAETYYGKGHGSKYTQIFEANRPMLSDPDKIYPGQALRIPNANDHESGASAQEWKPPQEIANAEKKSDSVWKSPTT